jgi:tRNA-splicing endonuclease subunit Sen34
MALPGDSVTEPIAISMVAGRYLLFDTNVVTYLRRTYNICGVLIGSIPQIPQQNVFLGLPVELLPEEAKLLIIKKAAYIMDDTSWHTERFSALKGSERKKYLDSLRKEGRKAQRNAEHDARKRSERGLAREALKRDSKNAKVAPLSTAKYVDSSGDPKTINDEETFLFGGNDAPFSTPTGLSPPTTYTVTPTTSYDPSYLPQKFPQQPDPAVPVSYPLFAHLHAKNYFITPGLRFGCDYTVYPGDPLRFHSHFLAVGYKWNDKIPLLDLVGGGRLGTGVKKGFLIGGESIPTSADNANSVRTFCIEWGGM